MTEKKGITIFPRKKAGLLLASFSLAVLIFMTGCSNNSASVNNDVSTPGNHDPDMSTTTPTSDDTVMDFEYSQPMGTKLSIVDVQQGERYLPAEMYIAFADSEYLSDAVLNATVPAVCKSTTLIDVNSGGAQLKIAGAQEGAMPESKLCGVSNHAALAEFISGERQLTEGRFFESKDECIISENLSKHTSLSIGDTMTFENITLGENGKKITYNMKIVGIYSDRTQEYASPYPVPYFNRRNEIITGFETIMDAENAASGAGVMLEADYYLKDGASLSDFEQELRNKGLPNGFSVRES